MFFPLAFLHFTHILSPTSVKGIWMASEMLGNEMLLK